MQDAIEKVYRWNLQWYGGGLVLAESLDDAMQKVTAYLKTDPIASKQLDTLSVWHWSDDLRYNSEYPNVLDIC